MIRADTQTQSAHAEATVCTPSQVSWVSWKDQCGNDRSAAVSSTPSKTLNLEMAVSTVETPDNSTQEAKSSKSISDRLGELILNAIRETIESRSKRYFDPKRKRPTLEDIPRIINEFSFINSTISASFSILPPPINTIAAIPEIAVLYRNHCAMIYDLAVAHNKEHQLSKELVLGILTSSAFPVPFELIRVQGNKIIVRRYSLKMFQIICNAFGANILQKTIKSALTKIIPYAGAALLSAWTNYTTRAIGKTAIEILSKQISEDNAETDEVSECTNATSTESEPTETQEIIDIEIKAPIYFAIMMADEKRRPEEIEYISKLINDSNLSAERKSDLSTSISNGELPEYSLDPFMHSIPESEQLIMELIAIAGCDKQIVLPEIQLINDISTQLGISTDDKINLSNDETLQLYIDTTTKYNFLSYKQAVAIAAKNHINSLPVIKPSGINDSIEAITQIETAINTYKSNAPRNDIAAAAIQSKFEYFHPVIISIILDDPLGIFKLTCTRMKMNNITYHQDATSVQIEYFLDAIFGFTPYSGRNTSTKSQKLVRELKKLYNLKICAKTSTEVA